MRIIKISEEVSKRADHLYSHNASPAVKEAWHNRRTVESANILNEANCPIEPGFFAGLNYDTKTDRYVMAFTDNSKKFSYKVTEEVAQFVAENSKLPGYWRLKMDKGTITDVVLVSY